LSSYGLLFYSQLRGFGVLSELPMSMNKLDATEENGGHNCTSQYLRLVRNLAMVAEIEHSWKPTKTNFSQVAHDVKN
jgi:hypothetical protein